MLVGYARVSAQDQNFDLQRDPLTRLWLRKSFGFAGAGTRWERNQLLAYCFRLPVANKA